MVMPWVEWCQLFGYGSRSVPSHEAFFLWGGTALTLIAAGMLTLNFLLKRID